MKGDYPRFKATYVHDELVEYFLLSPSTGISFGRWMAFSDGKERIDATCQPQWGRLGVWRAG